LAPDIFEPDPQASETDLADPRETMPVETQPSTPPRSLFQIVCLRGAPAPGTL
jgi:hypothetical protein